MNAQELKSIIGDESPLTVRLANTGNGHQIGWPVGTKDNRVENDIRNLKDHNEDGVLTTSDEQKVDALYAALDELRAAGVQNVAFRLTAKSGNEWRQWPHLWVPSEGASTTADPSARQAVAQSDAIATLKALLDNGTLTAEQFGLAVANMSTGTKTQTQPATDTDSEDIPL